MPYAASHVARQADVGGEDTPGFARVPLVYLRDVSLDEADAQGVLQRSVNAGLLSPSNEKSVRRFWQHLDRIVTTPGSNA